jgi:hypothetical protein
MDKDFMDRMDDGGARFLLGAVLLLAGLLIFKKN